MKRMNLIIEGVPPQDDLYAYVIKLADEFDLTIYMRDLTLVSRLKRKSVHDKRPGPVLVCFVHAFLRDKILRLKKGLKTSDRYSDVWVKADKTLDVRRFKSEFRKIAYQARSRGENVYFNHEMITIGDTIYYEKDLGKIPAEYKARDGVMPANVDRTRQEPPKEQQEVRDRERRPRTLIRPSERIAERREQTVTVQMELGATALDPSEVNETADNGAEMANMETKPKHQEDEKIRKTAHGILFSGRTAYLSNLYECEVEEDNIVHKTNEHGYFFNKAKIYKRPDIAKAIIEEPDQGKLKSYFNGLGDNPEWNRLRAPTLRRLFERKMKQHPELENRLMDTAPHRLIEASVDPLLGGGGASPFPRKSTMMVHLGEVMNSATLQPNTATRNWLHFGGKRLPRNENDCD